MEEVLKRVGEGEGESFLVYLVFAMRFGGRSG
jgi:hypothetical protein